MEPPSSRAEEPPSWEDLYKINLMPSELFVKFRKELQGLRVGVNLELYNEPTNDYHAKLVLKPLCPERKWKFIYEPLHQEVRVQSKKIPVTRFLNLQVGVGHNFQMNAIGWKWKLTSCLGGDGVSRIRNKTTLGLSPGIDFRFGWRADFVLPEGPWDRGTFIQHELRAFRGITGQSRGHYNPFRLSIANPYSSCWACLKEHTLRKRGQDLDNIRRQTCESTSTWCSQPKHKILL